MKPTIYFVANEKGKRHRAFSGEQPAFCGRVAHGMRWFSCSSSPSHLGARNCKECARSPLNGEVSLIDGAYIPRT